MGGGGSKGQRPPVAEGAPALPPIRNSHTDKPGFNPNQTTSFSPPSGSNTIIGNVGNIGGTGLAPQPPPHMTSKKMDMGKRPSFEYASSYVRTTTPLHSMSYPPPKIPPSTPQAILQARKDRSTPSSTQKRSPSLLSPASSVPLTSLNPSGPKKTLKKEDSISIDKIDSNFDMSNVGGRERARSQADKFYEQLGKGPQSQSNSLSNGELSTTTILKMMGEFGELNGMLSRSQHTCVVLIVLSSACFQHTTIFPQRLHPL